MKQGLTRRRTATIAGLGAAVGIGALGGGMWFFGRTHGAPGASARGGTESLFHAAGDPILGNPDAAFSFVEFYDYRCPFCIKMHEVIEYLLLEDRDIRFVSKHWPVFGGVSADAAKIAIASNFQGKFQPVNDALFEVARHRDLAKIRTAVEGRGVDMPRLDADLTARASEIDEIIGRSTIQATSLGLQGTPGFVVGNIMVPGAMTYDNLVDVVARARVRLAAKD